MGRDISRWLHCLVCIFVVHPQFVEQHIGAAHTKLYYRVGTWDVKRSSRVQVNIELFPFQVLVFFHGLLHHVVCYLLEPAWPFYTSERRMALWYIQRKGTKSHVLCLPPSCQRTSLCATLTRHSLPPQYPLFIRHAFQIFVPFSATTLTQPISIPSTRPTTTTHSTAGQSHASLLQTLSLLPTMCYILEMRYACGCLFDRTTVVCGQRLPCIQQHGTYVERLENYCCKHLPSKVQGCFDRVLRR